MITIVTTIIFVFVFVVFVRIFFLSLLVLYHYYLLLEKDCYVNSPIARQYSSWFPTVKEAYKLVENEVTQGKQESKA
jgi:hypothetical protein